MHDHCDMISTLVNSCKSKGSHFACGFNDDCLYQLFVAGRSAISVEMENKKIDSTIWLDLWFSLNLRRQTVRAAQLSRRKAGIWSWICGTLPCFIVTHHGLQASLVAPKPSIVHVTATDLKAFLKQSLLKLLGFHCKILPRPTIKMGWSTFLVSLAPQRERCF